MRHLRNNQGFTLIELVVSIGTAAVVMAAASMLLLMGVRTQRDVLDAAKEQQTARTVLTMLENLASDGTVQKVEPTNTGWSLQNKAGQEVLNYTVDGGKLSAKSGTLLEGLNTAHAELYGQMLTFSFETKYDSYSTSVFCRLLETPPSQNGDVAEVIQKVENAATSGVAETDKRNKFLKTLCDEYGSTGQIKKKVSGQGAAYYSEWYIGSYLTNPGWNKNTPWCACYLSWAAAQYVPRHVKKDDGNGGVTWVQASYIFADVDYGWRDMDTVKDEDMQAGDYIFFDWERDGDPDHVGVVIFEDTGNNIIYTIEGNSGNRVAIRSYYSGDVRIMGYRALPWGNAAS